MRQALWGDTVVNDVGVHGLLGWFGTPWVLENLHRHNDIELNFVARGEMRCLIGGRSQLLAAGQLAVFWALTPHRITGCDGHTLLGVVHVPLLEFLRWHVPANLRDRLLRGKLLLDGRDADFDELLFRRWAADLQRTRVPTPTEHPQDHLPVLLEVEARLRRLARHDDPPEAAVNATTHEVGVSKAEQLAQLLAERHAEDLDLARVAREVGLHPNYAMNLFRAALGMTMLQYLTHHRVAHAQRLLITTELPIIDVAHEAGFGSVGHFYAVFKRESGMAPRTYRAQHFK